MTNDWMEEEVEEDNKFVCPDCGEQCQNCKPQDEEIS